MKKNFYVTTPIYYPSGKLHIGHAYTTVAADVLKRYKQTDGYNAYFLTGMDEHGEKIEIKAKEANLTPQEFVDEMAIDIKSVWKMLDVEYDCFLRTTDEKHVKQVQYIFDRLLKQDDIYKGEYEGKYCTSCESYFTDTQLDDGNCPDCGGPVKIIKEESYFFRCGKYIDRLVEHMDANEDFILPKSRKNELVNSFIKPGIQDLAVSRTNFKWGVPVQSDPDHVVYVWIDALSNYITALGYQDNDDLFKEFWPADVHLMGKEIIRFHVIYWPMILMALDLPLPKQLFAHGWLLMDAQKMSKSKGNVIYPDYIVENYGVDTLRYFLMREIPFGVDGQFTPESFVSRVNDDIVNDLGNLVNRTISMVNKYFDGTVNYSPRVDELTLAHHTDYNTLLKEFHENMDKLQFSRALEVCWKYISLTNKFIDLTQPWVLAKDESTKDELEAVMFTLLRLINQIATLVYPFTPTYAKTIKAQIGQREEFSYDLATPNTFNVTDTPVPLLMRLEVKEEVEKIRAEMLSHLPPVVEEKEFVDFDQFKKTVMKVGEVLSVEKHKNADKLLVLQIDMGTEVKQIVSGLAEFYSPTSLVGQKLIIVDNLKPVTIRKEESNGMILTTNIGKKVQVISVDKDTENGCVVE